MAIAVRVAGTTALIWALLSSSIAMRAAAQTIPGLGPDAGPPCGRCHQPGRAPVADYTQDKACMTCHLGVLPASDPEPAPRLSVVSPGQPLAPAAETRPEPPATTSQMVFIPEGPFWMGNNGRESVSEGPGDRDERPLHLVYVDGFRMDLYEVTNAQYETFVKAAGHRRPWHWREGKIPPGKAHHPVVFVDWHDATAYCRWAGKRLPTEPEWEKAARGTDGRAFPWGHAFDPLKANTPQYWLQKGRTGDTMPVGSLEAGKSPYGLYDMAGNVYEWTASWYLPYPGSAVLNIHYGFRNKVVRGGSWYDCLTYGCGLSSPAYNRSRFAPEIRNSNFGFRCAQSHSSDRAGS